jgi:lysophospholipase L1-like esterase
VRYTKENDRFAVGGHPVISISALLLLTLLLVNCQSRNRVQEQSAQTRMNDVEVTKESHSPPLTGPINYVALGDSTGIGVGSRNGDGYVALLFRRIQGTRSDSKLTNLCVSGATSDDVRRAQLDRAVRAKPTLVTLGIGINDIGHGVSPQDFGENLEAILSRLQSESHPRLIVSNIPDISTAPRIPQIMRGEIKRVIVLFNKEINDIAKRHGAVVVDIHSLTHEQLASHPEYFSQDGFHPSDAGYEMWAEQMWPAVAKEIGAATQ